MSKKLQLKIVTPEKLILDEEVESVSVPTTEGEITVLADHIPLIASLSFFFAFIVLTLVAIAVAVFFRADSANRALNSIT